MLLVDATGYRDTRFQRLDDAVLDIKEDGVKSVMINRSLANGVLTYVEARLLEAFGSGIVRVSLGHGTAHVERTLELIHSYNVLIIDEAEKLEGETALADALRALENQGKAVVYVALVHSSETFDRLLEKI